MTQQTMEFSKKYQVVKLIIFGLVITFCMVSWLIYRELPSWEFLAPLLGAIGFSDAPYMWKTGKENPVKIESAAEVEKTKIETDAENERLKAELAILKARLEGPGDC